jgi:DNA-binding MarR family transcriptional regulator
MSTTRPRTGSLPRPRRSKVPAAPSDDTSTDKASGEKRRAIELGPLALHTGYLIRRAQLAIFNDLISAFGDDNIRLAEYSVLMVLDANPGVSHGDVAGALGIKRTNFVGLFNRLEERGLVERRTVPTDGRANALFLTPAGKKLHSKLTRIASVHEDRINSLIGDAGKQQLQLLLPILAKLGDTRTSDEN